MLNIKYLWLTAWAALILIIWIGLKVSARKASTPADKISSALHDLSQSVEHAEERYEKRSPDHKVPGFGKP